MSSLRFLYLEDKARDRELVAEALFLCDPVPPTAGQIGLSLSLAQDRSSPTSQPAAMRATPRRSTSPTTSGSGQWPFAAGARR